MYVGRTADPDFWDERWDSEALQRVLTDPPLHHYNRLLLEMTKKHVPAGGRILEGGCGTGDKVALFRAHGFDAIGLDFAARTLERAHAIAPSLPLVQGDVRALPWTPDSFDAYWSLGVIEHFYDGYDAILAEMRRVLRPGGVLLLSVPALSLVRRWTGRLGILPSFEEDADTRATFYQFALNPSSVIQDFQAGGFDLVEWSRGSGLLGLESEVPALRIPLKVLYKVAFSITEATTSRFANHVAYFVFKLRG